MKEPMGELLHLSFYLHDQTPSGALIAVVEAMIRDGADFAGIARGCKTSNKTQEYFVPKARIYRNEQVRIESMKELHSWLSSPDIQILEILMKNASDTNKDEYVVVTYENISESAAQQDVPPVSILSTGDLFSLARLPLSDSNKYMAQSKKAGKKVYTRLKAIVEAINPSYASITIEWPLESPSDLRTDPRSLAFRDFYIKESFIGTTQIDLFKNLYNGAYIEDMKNGIYVSCTREFNPRNIDVDRTAPPWNTISTRVGKIIANASI